MRDTPNHYECHICSDFNRKCTRQFIVFYFRRVLHLTVVHLRRPATVSHHYRHPVRLSMHQTRHRDARPLRTQVRIIRQVNGREHRSRNLQRNLGAYFRYRPCTGALPLRHIPRHHHHRTPSGHPALQIHHARIRTIRKNTDKKLSCRKLPPLILIVRLLHHQ